MNITNDLFEEASGSRRLAGRRANAKRRSLSNQWSVSFVWFLVKLVIVFIIYSDFKDKSLVKVEAESLQQQKHIDRQAQTRIHFQQQSPATGPRVEEQAPAQSTNGDGERAASAGSKANGATKSQTKPPPPPTTTTNGNNNNKMTIETAVFLDQALSSRYASRSQGLADLNKLVLTIMNQVKYMFQYGSLMKSIDIKLVLVESLKDSERRGTMKSLPSPEQGDIDLYLSNFCQWQQTRLETNKDQLWWDHAILLSGLDLYKTSPTGNQSGVLGLSWVGGMCKGNYSCTVGEAIHLESAFVIAHEIGHSLGMMHDGNRNNCDPNRYIMSDKTGAGKINWSRCSNNYLADALKRNQLACLNQNSTMPGSTDPLYDLTKLKPPGQVYSLNEQCRLAYGSNYSRFISHDAPYNNVCQELWCVSGSWARPVHPALEGSSCDRSQDSQFTCREGKCL